MVQSIFARAARHPDVGRFARFALIGAVATALQFLILVGLVELAHAEKPWANAAGYAVSAVLNYALNRAFAFKGAKTSFLGGFARFAIASAIGLALNSMVFIALLRAGLPYVAAWAGAVGLVLIWNYAAARYVIFRPSA